MEGHRHGDGVGGSGAHLAVVAGIFATGGSLLGKLAGGADASSLPSLLLKAALLALMITCNTVGCTFFVKALNGSGSSLPVTVASAATNYVCSALVGFAVFDESTSLLWWCGTSLVLLGLALTCYVPVEKGTSAVETRLKQQ
ncbi:transmembrane protein 42 [Harpegnathos saltator]|uniref:transmembrane protein 42 n=1 Tax=Harpegnathos saltator TaxID=610380 RepID=UPI00058CB734|nr:transmembrane protein 42 [Harpegnathos saltator]XP_011154707.1 transmembrane protein 42 [Harpegnathos saltator]